MSVFFSNCHGAARGWPRCGPVVFERNDQKLSKITVFGPVSNTTYASYLGIGGLKNGHFSLFWDQFQTRLTLHMSGLGVWKIVTFHCFLISFKHDLPFISRDWRSKNSHFSLVLDQFQTRLSLHISGLEGLEMCTFLVWGASCPCSAECCLVIIGRFPANAVFSKRSWWSCT